MYIQLRTCVMEVQGYNQPSHTLEIWISCREFPFPRHQNVHFCQVISFRCSCAFFRSLLAHYCAIFLYTVTLKRGQCTKCTGALKYQTGYKQCCCSEFKISVSVQVWRMLCCVCAHFGECCFDYLTFSTECSYMKQVEYTRYQT